MFYSLSFLCNRRKSEPSSIVKTYFVLSPEIGKWMAQEQLVSREQIQLSCLADKNPLQCS